MPSGAQHLIALDGSSGDAANCDDRRVAPALHAAVRQADKGLVQELLARGISANQRDSCGQTALMWAFALSVPEVTKSLSPSKAEVATVAKQLETENLRRMEIAWLLLERGGDANAIDLNGDSVLSLAAGFGGGGAMLSKVVTRLLTSGADVNLRNGRGETPLMSAAWSGRLDIARTLIEKGANVSARDLAGRTAEDLAQAAGRQEMVRFLRAHLDER